MSQAYYHDSVESFLNTKTVEVIGKLNLAGTDFASQWTITNDSWASCIEILKLSLQEIIQKTSEASKWHIAFEYEIPRLMSRIDVVIIADDVIFVLEFKYERRKFEKADAQQAEDYALDLSDFHLESRGKIIVPVLLAPLSSSIKQENNLKTRNNVKPSLKANSSNLSFLIHTSYLEFHNPVNKKINAIDWIQSEYRPTPTIIQAANALFAGQGVKEISNFGADNLAKTSKSIIDIINKSKVDNKKVICFVTGVPGAGKTLVGLNIVHENDNYSGDDFNSSYFSGNAPLIKVLKESLSRDDFQRHNNLYKTNQINSKPKKSESRSKIKSKIQNLHQIIKDGLSKKKFIEERVVVFDEAQRCWDAIQFSNKAKQNRNRETAQFKIEEKSEAELLLEFMNRHNGWAVIIALVGGGQEINTGEGGIGEWGKAIQFKYPNWEINISPQLLAGDSSTANQKLFQTIPKNLIIHENESLHLSVSQRSFKASQFNEWVNAIIDNDPQKAALIADLIRQNYPLFITRDINKAKNWLKEKKVGTKRFGLVASSGGLRLKPYGINVREEIDETLWFLNDENDIRSSYYLEIAATEYKVQGLELDWVGICWDADLRRLNDKWAFNNFSGTKWQHTNSVSEQQFLLNTYRVLLTRAREGIIIFVPKGDVNDQTRLPIFYDPIFEFLRSCGLQEL